MNSRLSKITTEQAKEFCYSIFILDLSLGRYFITSFTGEDLFESLFKGLLNFIKKENIAKSVTENLFNKQVSAKIIMDEFIKLMREKLQ